MSWQGAFLTSTWLRIGVESIVLFAFATLVFDAIHYTLHQFQRSSRRLFRWFGALHQAHHVFCDKQLVYHDSQVTSNLIRHILPEYGSQMAVAAFGFLLLSPISVGIVMSLFTSLFVGVIYLGGKDWNHQPMKVIKPAHETMFVQAQYHSLHHVYPDSYMSSYTTLFDRIMGTACQIRGRTFVMTGASGSFGSAFKRLIENAGGEVLTLKYGVDYTYNDYTKAEAAFAGADVLVLAHGLKSGEVMEANCTSFLELIERFRHANPGRVYAPEVWAVGSEIECHPAFGIPELQAYAKSKRAFARQASRLFFDHEILYRHIVPSAFSSPMGPGLISGRVAAWVAFRMIRHGFRYVPVTYTGIAFINYVPFVLRGIPTRLSGWSQPSASAIQPDSQHAQV